MSYVDLATGFVAPFEGFRATIYHDAVGVPTIGYGETDPGLLHKYAHGITQREARALLRVRLEEFNQQIAPAIKVKLSDQQRAAVLSFAYNLGVGALKSSSLLRYLNEGRMAKAANEFPKWDRAGGRELAGLKRRREAERRLFLQGSNHWTRIIARRR